MYTIMKSRGVRTALVALMALAAVPVLAAPAVIEVYKTASCGCCALWVTHLRQHGFSPRVADVEDIGAVKLRHAVPRSVATCHTALVQGYVIEGHVPATDILRLLQERPDVRGLAVAGMPAGSPGMEGPTSEAYDVVAFDKAGKLTVFARHRR